MKILGILSLLVQAIGIVPYIRDIFLGKTKPERASFWIFFLLISVTFAAQISDRLTWASALTGLFVLCTGAIAVLSLKYGYGSFKRKDAVSIGIAVLGMGLWLITSRPLIAVLIVIAVDMAGFWLTLQKAWKAPYTETLFAWAASGVAATLALIAAQTTDLVQISYILYTAFANMGICLMLVYRRKAIPAKS